MSAEAEFLTRMALYGINVKKDVAQKYVSYPFGSSQGAENGDIDNN
jgi:hypothetical protein